MSALASIRRTLREYRADHGVTRMAMLFEFAVIAGSLVLLATGGWTFALVTP